MNKKPNHRSANFKFKIAIEAIKGEKTIVQIASDYELHPKQIVRWRNQLLAEGEELFIHKTTKKFSNNDPDREKLLHLVNQLGLELEFLKKKLKSNA